MFAICSPAYGSFPFLRLFGRSGAELLINRVGGETSPFQEDAVANHDDAIESQAGLRAVPCDELLDGVLVDAARTRRRETVEHRCLGVIQIRQPKHGATIVRLGSIFPHTWRPLLPQHGIYCTQVVPRNCGFVLDFGITGF